MTYTDRLTLFLSIKKTLSQLIVNGIAFEIYILKFAMNLNNLTTKSQESIQRAQQLAFESNNQQIENEHLFQGILEIDDNVIPYLFSKLNVIFFIRLFFC